MSRYAALFTFALSRRLRSPTEMLGRGLLYVIILSIWWRVWNMTAFAGFDGFTPSSVLWYLAGTEWIVLSIPYVYLDMEATIRSGDFAYELQRPGSYAGYQVAQAFGLATANWLVHGVIGVATARLLSGVWPDVSLATFTAMALLAWLATLASALVMVTLGFVAVWTNDAAPCAWVWQKTQFVLGGLMLPLSIYPESLQRFARLTPFPALLGGIMQPLASGDAASHPLGRLAALALWTALFAVVLAFFASRAIKRTQEG